MTKATKQANPVEAAEAMLAQLEQKRQRHRERGVELEAARKRASFGAHALHDPEQRKTLADVVDETVRHETEGRALDDAIDEARRRVEQARQIEVRAADRGAATQLRATLAEFVAQGEAIDAALATIAEIGSAMRATLSEMHTLGSAFPSHQQLDVLGVACLRTALQRTPWDRHFERLAPNQRRDFATLVAGWHATIERDIAARLGEKQTEEADADAA